jgi:hypothetical protein
MKTQSELRISCRDSNQEPHKYEVEFLGQYTTMPSAGALPPRRYTPS